MKKWTWSKHGEKFLHNLVIYAWRSNDHELAYEIHYHCAFQWTIVTIKFRFVIYFFGKSSFLYTFSNVGRSPTADSLKFLFIFLFFILKNIERVGLRLTFCEVESCSFSCEMGPLWLWLTARTTKRSLSGTAESRCSVTVNALQSSQPGGGAPRDSYQ